MADSASYYSKPKQAYDTLTYENLEEWFEMMRIYLTGQDLWYYVKENKIEHLGQGTPSSSTTTTPGVDNLPGFGNEKPNAKAIYAIVLCLSADDREAVVRESSTRKI